MGRTVIPGRHSTSRPKMLPKVDDVLQESLRKLTPILHHIADAERATAGPADAETGTAGPAYKTDTKVRAPVNRLFAASAASS
jgi:hypothetical protein